jgi:hypothetical protein
MAVSVFGNRRPLRSILPATSTFQVAKEVRTEDELRQALQPLDGSSVAALVANTGRRIIITAPITLKSKIVIDASLPGTVIESNGYLPIICGNDQIDAFVVRAPLCTLSGLLFTSATLSGAATLGEFLTCVRVEGTADFCRILDCNTFDCDSLLVVEDGASEGMLRGCAVGVTSSANADCVTIDAAGWRVEHNILDGAGTGVAIRVTANGERTAIVGNDMASDGITTDASVGINFIVGNTRAGALTTHATDIVLQAAGGATLADGVYGDITVSGGGTIMTVTSGGGGTFGQATATFTVNTDSVVVSVVDAGVSAGSNIVPTIATAPGRDADEFERAPVLVSVASITAGVGFDLIVVSLDGDADGSYLINYTRD